MSEVLAQGPGSALGTNLQQLLIANDIAPGFTPSYELCKTIYLYHPMGAKMVEKPLEIAQSQKRTIKCPDSPEERIVEEFNAEWERMGADGHIFNVMSQARIYGIASIALMEEDSDPAQPIDFKNLSNIPISFNVFDPLNTAGSLVLSQNPNSIDFQHVTDIRVNSQIYHRSRTCVVMNEKPIYINFTPSAFGFVGRSVYQRALFPLKSFVQTMLADDFVAGKVGSMVAKIKQPGSIIDNAMLKMFNLKRSFVHELKNFGVLSISPDEAVESIDLTNVAEPLRQSRQDIIENIASATPMPARLLTEESFAEGFGEGSEDAKAVARFIDKVREQMAPLYHYFDRICMYRAWNPDFYAIVQEEFPEWKSIPYETAFYRWKNSFTTMWPNLLKEPDSELVGVDEVKLRAVMAMVQIISPMLKMEVNAENKTELVKWAVDNFNNLKLLFGDPLNLDYEKMTQGFIEVAQQQKEEQEAGLAEAAAEENEPRQPRPFAMLDDLSASVTKLADMRQKRLKGIRDTRAERRLLR